MPDPIGFVGTLIGVPWIFATGIILTRTEQPLKRPYRNAVSDPTVRLETRRDG